jgi:hypothetical protein
MRIVAVTDDNKILELFRQMLCQRLRTLALVVTYAIHKYPDN